MTANTTAANQSQAEEQQSNESKQNENSITSKFKQLPSEKQFGLITLAALGTAMLVTGGHKDVEIDEDEHEILGQQVELCVGERNDDDDHLNSSKADQEKAMDFNRRWMR
ncbi:hypothetical protein H4Q26_000725 [Puccinia striiformis f. sp. tritici PST-130]|nr:hypothetical protein H4Q26_000725 [Puccinia striiformis f. sp. tritici PST-130]